MKWYFLKSFQLGVTNESSKWEPVRTDSISRKIKKMYTKYVNDEILFTKEFSSLVIYFTQLASFVVLISSCEGTWGLLSP